LPSNINETAFFQIGIFLPNDNVFSIFTAYKKIVSTSRTIMSSHTT
jgi:hypothetical protein